MKVVFVDIHALLRDAHLYYMLFCLPSKCDLHWCARWYDMIRAELSWMQAWMSWYALRNAAKLKNKYSSAWRSAGKHNHAYSTTLCGAGATHAAAFSILQLPSACLTRMCIIWQQARQQAASTTDSAASCLALPVCIALWRWEAQFITIRYQVLIPISYYIAMNYQ